MIIGIHAKALEKEQKTGVEVYAENLIKNLAKIDNDNEYILYTKSPLAGEFKNLGANFKNKIIQESFGQVLSAYKKPLRFWKPERFQYIKALL